MGLTFHSSPILFAREKWTGIKYGCLIYCCMLSAPRMKLHFTSEQTIYCVALIQYYYCCCTVAVFSCAEETNTLHRTM